MKPMILISLLLSAGVPLAAAQAATMQDALKEYGIKVDAGSAITVTKDQHLSGTTKTQHLIEAESGAHERFEVKIISPVEAQAAAAMIESESSALKKLFMPAQTPYMGDIAQAIGGCPVKFGPLAKSVSVLKNNSQALLGAANDKLSFGACSLEQAKYKAAFVAYYDEPSKAVWTWRIFVPWTNPPAALKSDWLKPVLSRFQK
jgi:hypothetical protein